MEAGRGIPEIENEGTYTYTPTQVFFDGPGIDEHLGYAYTPDGGTNWTRYTYLLGHQSTVRAALAASGAVQERYLYDPNGNRRIYAADWTPRTATQVHNDYGYTGRTHDPAAGLLYYRNRWYHPSFGRFITYDPIGLWGDSGNWGNGYGYLGNREITRIDPSGLYSTDVHFYATYSMARNLGFSKEDSQRLAWSNENVDHHPHSKSGLGVTDNYARWRNETFHFGNLEGK